MNNGHSQPAVAKPTVVVVDDDMAVRNSLKFFLEVEGFLVRAYASAADLFADGTMPDVGCLVIDYKLPLTNGLELLAELRRRKIALPAILITTNPSSLLRAQAAAAGAALIEKPLLNEALFECIRTALRPARPA
jgi:FixJ family two-component response regulator